MNDVKVDYTRFFEVTLLFKLVILFTHFGLKVI